MEKENESIYLKLISLFAKDIGFIIKILSVTICIGILIGIVCGVVTKDYHIFNSIVEMLKSSILGTSI